MQYYGTRLSNNISRREPEGYLLCLNVPVARTGTQDYLPSELGLPDVPTPIPVYRPPSEVFSPETIASFEGMPVTDDHPPDGVDADNIRHYQMGHAHNIRRGAGPESDLLLADLIITSPRLIEEILAGKREISCGYTYELHEEHNQYVQRKIRGNHIAVVDAGRAGARVSIRDHKAKTERRTQPMKTSLTKVLARMARDGNAEAVAEFIEEMISHEPAGNLPEPINAENAEEPETVPEPAPAEEPVTLEVPENRTVLIDSETAGAFLQRLDRLLDLLAACLAPAAADETPAGYAVEKTAEKAAEKAAEEIAETAAEATETAVAEAVEEILGESGNTEAEVSEILEESGDECSPQDPTEAKDALRAVLKAVRPALAEMSPARRKKLSADIAANLRAGKDASASNVYAALLKNSSAPVSDPADLGKRIMAKRNPNYR